MKYILPVIVTLPTILIMIGLVIRLVTGRFLFEELGIPSLVVLLPVLSFAACVALIFVFPDRKEWKVAAAINAVPLLLVTLVMLLFALIGYNG